jgi:conjugative relaxase-like TrwC/TraI family protein
VLTVHRLSAGDGYKYLLRHIASGDTDRSATSSLTTYYAAAGYPPGRWFGTGLAGLGTPRLTLRPDDEVTEPQMTALFGRGEDPLTNHLLGRPFPVYRSVHERVDARVTALRMDLTAEERSAEIERITAEESDRKTRQAVAGFDLTFSPAKSVSALWAIADPGVQEQIVAAHHHAVHAVLNHIEREAAFSRTGERGIAQIDTRGIVGAAFDHWESRAGDPQLHTHVVIANRVQGLDGQWRSLDGRILYQACVALSELYNDLLADKLTTLLGVDWSHRDRDPGHHPERNPAWEIDGVPNELLAEFSARSAQIEANLNVLLAREREATGRSPTKRRLYVLQQQATLMNRPHKHNPRPLDQLTREWRRRAERRARIRPDEFIAAVVGRSLTQPLTAHEIDPETVEAYAATVIACVHQRRATWTRWNLLAEAARQTRALRLATSDDRIDLLERIADQAQTQSISLAAPELIAIPDRLRRRDGASIFTVHNAQRYTSTAILGAEALLLDHAHSRTGPRVSADLGAVVLQGSTLSSDQIEAVRRIATSGQVVEALIGPAGTGKTTTLAALRQTWEQAFGAGSVIGIAPSAAAAEVLGDRLGIKTENIAKWIHESLGAGAQERTDWLTVCRRTLRKTRRRADDNMPRRWLERLRTVNAEAEHWTLHPGQLMIVDEASLASTTQLAALARQAANAGAKLLLVGDDAQLSSVESGGAFRLIARDTNAATLSTVWRFQHDWERTASLQLRHGNTEAITTYTDHQRIHTGDDDAMHDQAYTAWRTDHQQGLRTLMIAANNDTVADLNTRARLDRITSGDVEPHGVTLHDGTHAGTGDRIITRLNQRRLTTNHGRYLRNGNEWTITRRHRDGSLTAQSDTGDTITLPGRYVATSVELGYATTAHRAQGATVDTAHLIVTDNLSRELLYVGMTRGRTANHAYIATTNTQDEQHQHHRERTARDILHDILNRSDAERSAHEIMRAELDATSRLDRLVPIHEHLAQIAAADRYSPILHNCGIPSNAIANSRAYGPLLAALRDAESRGLDPNQLLPHAINRSALHTAKDIAAVIHARIDRLIRRAERRGHLKPPTRLAGVATSIRHSVRSDLDAALRDTEALITDRVAHDTRAAPSSKAHPQLRTLADQPIDEAGPVQSNTSSLRTPHAANDAAALATIPAQSQEPTA